MQFNVGTAIAGDRRSWEPALRLVGIGVWLARFKLVTERVGLGTE